MRALLLAVAFAAAPAGLTAQGVVTGVVVDASTGDTIRVATVQLLAEAGDTADTNTTSDGTFRLLVRAEGPYHLHATALGYDAVTSEPFDAGTSSGVVVEVRLGPRPVDLPALHVVSRRSDVGGLLSDYYRNLEWHRRTGFGTVLDREELEAYGSMPIRSIIVSQPGIQVHSRAGGLEFLTMRRAGQQCRPDIYINGLLAEPTDLFSLPVSSLEGIEIYRWTMPPEVPPMSARNTCGLIMAWQRADAGKPLTWRRVFMAAGLVLFAFLLTQL